MHLYQLLVLISIAVIAEQFHTLYIINLFLFRSELLWYLLDSKRPRVCISGISPGAASLSCATAGSTDRLTF